LDNISVNIFYKKNDEVYLGGTIRTIRNKIELFYHYPFGSNKEAQVEKSSISKNLLTDNLDNFGVEGVDDEYFYDHISFHTDGKIHSKRRNKSKKKVYTGELNLGFNPFNLTAGENRPIYISSFHVFQSETCEKIFKKNVQYDCSKDIICDITKYNSFSIVLISICDNANAEDLLRHEVIRKLNVFQAEGIKNVFSKEDKELKFENSSGFDSNLLILFIENVIADSVEGVYEDEKIWSAMVDVCNPPIEVFLNSKNYNLGN
jgi:hypothetical protein